MNRNHPSSKYLVLKNTLPFNLEAGGKQGSFWGGGGGGGGGGIARPSFSTLAPQGQNEIYALQGQNEIHSAMSVSLICAPRQ